MSIFYTILIFILATSIIVVFHEFGHYIAARICGVKVLEFSLGFGKKLIGKKYGKDKTEYKVCLLPLGGYVKMLDERELPVNEEDKNRAFNNQSLAKRFFIVFSGPLFNFILAIFFYFTIFFNGYTDFKPIVGSVISNSLAYNIGIKNDDIIYSVNNIRIKTWSDVNLQTIKFISEKNDIFYKILRNKKIILLDKIEYQKISLENENIIESIGILNFINKSQKIGFIEKNSPAEVSNLKVGDIILYINDKKINYWNDIVNIIKISPKKNLRFHVSRNNKSIFIDVIPQVISQGSANYGKLGISPLIDDQAILENTINVKHSIFESLKLSIVKTYDFSLLTFNFVVKLVKGEHSLKSISGPVGIANYAADSFYSGFISFISLLALLSISIGVLNLLPIPMLDGGHLMYYLVEFFFRKPIPDKFQLILQQAGISFLLVLSLYALYNDIMRTMQ